MLGKMSSLASIVQKLRENKVSFMRMRERRMLRSTNQQVDNYVVSELVQGQTKRWVIGWSYGDIRLPDASVPPL